MKRIIAAGAIICIFLVANNAWIQSRIDRAVTNERSLQAERDTLLNEAINFEKIVLHYHNYWQDHLIELTKNRNETTDQERQAELDKEIDQVYFEIGFADRASLIQLQDLQMEISSSSREELKGLRTNLELLQVEAEEFPQWEEVTKRKLIIIDE